MALLLDVLGLSEQQTNSTFEFICKAQGEDDISDAIFDEHPSPFIRHLVETFYERGLMRISDFREELEHWLAGQRHNPGASIPPRPAGAMARWSPAELRLVRVYLAALQPSQFTADDWMMLIDYLFQRYLPADDMRTEAEWVATRAVLMGRVQANREKVTPSQADKIMAALPATVDAAQAFFAATPLQAAVLRFAATASAEHVSGLTDAWRHRFRRAVLEVQEQRLVDRPGTTASALQERLLYEFGTMNRDWRRIAVSEAGENFNQGQILATPAGAHVRRHEMYRGACPFCRRIDGKVMTVVPADAPDKDGDTQIWVGKTNVGRSAAPRKRVGDDLVERKPEERWWIPAGIAHPHCRGTWTAVAAAPADADPQFSQWLKSTLGEHRAAA